MAANEQEHACLCLLQHPSLRTGLFASGSIARTVRAGVLQYSGRQQFLPSVARLYGLGLWNTQLVDALRSEWREPAERLNGTLSVVQDDRTFADLLQDANANKVLLGPEASALVLGSSTAAAASASGAGGRITPMDDREFLKLLPSLEPRKFAMAGVIKYDDEQRSDTTHALAWILARRRICVNVAGGCLLVCPESMLGLQLRTRGLYCRCCCCYSAATVYSSSASCRESQFTASGSPCYGCSQRRNCWTLHDDQRHRQIQSFEAADV